MSEGTDWVEQARRLVAGLGETGLGQALFEQAGTDGRDRVPTGGHVPGGDCGWCPVCRLAAVARRPEVSEALADALTSAATALRAFAAAAAAEAADPAGPAATEDETAGGEPAPPAAPVQHIEIA